MAGCFSFLASTPQVAFSDKSSCVFGQGTIFGSIWYQNWQIQHKLVAGSVMPKGVATLQLLGAAAAAGGCSRKIAGVGCRSSKSKSSTIFCRAGKNVPPSRFGTPFPETSPVPWEQVPINQFNSLRSSRYFSWPLEPGWSYGLKLGTIAVSCSLLLGWPVTSLSVDPRLDLLKCCIGTLGTGAAASTLAALRLYLGWLHVGNRLSSSVVEYEETGWYDGQVWVKPREVLARDQLVSSYTVKPALRRLRVTLTGLAMFLSACVVCFSVMPTPAPAPVPAPPPSHEQLQYAESSARSFEPDAFL